MSEERAEILLTEIRDLLEVVSGALRPEYETQTVKRLGADGLALRNLVRSEKRWAAVLLLDGSRTQSDVVRESGLAQSGVSTLVKVLADAGFLSNDGARPKVRFKRAELEALRNAGG